MVEVEPLAWAGGVVAGYHGAVRGAEAVAVSFFRGVGGGGWVVVGRGRFARCGCLGLVKWWFGVCEGLL